MPIGFKTGDQWISSGTKKITVSIFDKDDNNGTPQYKSYSMKAKYRDFNWGEANKWRANEWEKYIPNIKKIGVVNAVKSLNESYGGQGIGLAMYYAFVK